MLHRESYPCASTIPNCRYVVTCPRELLFEANAGIPSQETRPPGPGPHSYSYHEHLSRFKTGDLIVYSGTGILGAVSQLMTNSPYSHVGLVVQLPNKWTTEDDL